MNTTADRGGVVQFTPILELQLLGSIRRALSIRDGEVIGGIPSEFDDGAFFRPDDELQNGGNGQGSKGRRRELVLKLHQ